jgi:tetratricopeptide (TPR) repeat protein
MRLQHVLMIAGALGALAIWPAFVTASANHAAAAASPTMAPVTPDYEYRDRYIAFYEKTANRDKYDQLLPRMLAGEYLQRYREHGDVGDILRAEHEARVSLERSPRANVGADMALSSALLDLHLFRQALLPVEDARRYGPHDASLLAREAGLYLEIGDYAKARAAIDAAQRLRNPDDSSVAIVRSRYDELTGHLARARSELAGPMTQLDSIFDAPAENRAWFHFHAGEMAFEAGDNAQAEADFKTALAIFPNYWHANAGLAQLYACEHRWSEALAAAQASANVIPFPNTLGYVADAQRALGQGDAAQQTDDLIVAIERIGNAQRLSDRLLSVYYAEHGVRKADALAIAERELEVRDDVLTEDTIAWAAAVDGKWDLARKAAAKAVRFHTQNALIDFHAGMIALHFGDRAEAKRRLSEALGLNPEFHPFYADQARRTLKGL